MPTFEQVQERIRSRIEANKAKGADGSSRSKPLEWNRETASTITSACRRYRIVGYKDSKNTFEYWLWSIASVTQAPKKITGPFVTPKEARDAAQDHANGMPMQADLS